MIRIFDSIDSFGQLQTPSAVALGFFDGVHLGHRAVIGRAAADDPSLLSVVLTFRESPAAALGRPTPGLLLTNDEKSRRLEALGVKAVVFADFCALKEMSADDFVRDILRDRLCARTVYCGFNYHFGRGGKASCSDLRRLCAENGVRAVCCPPVAYDGDTVSSTRIRSLLECGDIERANRLLCEPYALSGIVVQGNRIGTSLGFPTVNLPLDPRLAVPRFGVYAARVDVGGRCYAGATNIGVHPTAGAKPHPLCETFILDFDGDLYGADVRVSLMRFLRDERRFGSLEELREQAARDCATVKKLKPV